MYKKKLVDYLVAIFGLSWYPILLGHSFFIWRNCSVILDIYSLFYQYIVQRTIVVAEMWWSICEKTEFSVSPYMSLCNAWFWFYVSICQYIYKCYIKKKKSTSDVVNCSLCIDWLVWYYGIYELQREYLNLKNRIN